MSKHILIVDDSKTVRNLVAFILKAEGFKVTTAEDGLDGLEKLYAMESVDLILSDINMPRMDGFTFIAQVREQDIYKDIPIIILSTEGEERDIQKGIQLGANLYMVKPAQPEKMVRNIKMLLGCPISVLSRCVQNWIASFDIMFQFVVYPIVRNAEHCVFRRMSCLDCGKSNGN